jgi:hypothetical protein
VDEHLGKGMSQTLRIAISAIFTVICGAGGAWANVDQSRQTSQVARAKADFESAAIKNKASVEALIPHYDAELKSAKEAAEKRKELFAQGLVSKSEVDAAEQAVKDAQAHLDQARSQIIESDQLIAEARAELTKPPASSAANGTGRYRTSAAVMRYGGAGGWTINQASLVKDFFASKFSRQLPVSAFGQSVTHNRLGFDHRNSVDVAVHPDSAEGKALIEYLRDNGIPFLAFRSAIPGVATGAHIHIGYPSHRT